MARCVCSVSVSVANGTKTALARAFMTSTTVLYPACEIETRHRSRSVAKSSRMGSTITRCADIPCNRRRVTLLIDNAGPLVVGRDRELGVARLHPAFAQFCRELDVAVRVCRPYRARTKGKTESGVGYVKRNAITGREFASFADLERHLAAWMVKADEREHGSTHEAPRVRFERDEASRLKPLPATPPPARERRLERRVATDCFVDVDTIRYSVPHRLIRERVEVLVGDNQVVIFHGGRMVATHRRATEPHSRVVDPHHLDGLVRAEPPRLPEASPLEAMGRSLSDYAALVGGGG